MPGIGGLHGVHRKRANRIDAFHFDRTGGILDGNTGFCCAHSDSFVALGLSVLRTRPFRLRTQLYFSPKRGFAEIEESGICAAFSPTVQIGMRLLLKKAVRTMARRSMRGRKTALNSY